MKKSSFVAMILATISIVLFAFGMCMTLVPEWDSLKLGVVFGIAGILLGIITIIVWRKMECKAAIHITGKAILTVMIAILGALLLGIGMCFCMIWNQLVLGAIIGLIGILMLLCLIPILKGIK